MTAADRSLLRAQIASTTDRGYDAIVAWDRAVTDWKIEALGDAGDALSDVVAMTLSLLEAIDLDEMMP